MKLVLPFYRHLSIARKISLLLVLVGTICFVEQSLHAYFLLSKNIERMLGKRLEHIARAAAMQIPGELHNQVLQGYLDQDPKLTEKASFREIQKLLQRIQTENELTTDVYTLIRPDWQPDMMLFLAMAKKETYVGNGLPMHPMALEAITTGRATHTSLYEDQHGVWVSAWAPIKTADDLTVGAVEVDYRASEELAAAKEALGRDLVWPVLGALLLSFLLGSASGNALARPVRKLAALAGQVAKGDLNVRAEQHSRDEVGQLASTFNLMVADLRKSREALEDYAKNLERKVAERTAELRAANETISAMINSLAQGFLVFGRDGTCLPVYSKACEKLLEGNPSGRFIWQVLRADEETMRGQTEFLFEEPIPFEDTAALCPKSFPHSRGNRVSLGYYPIRDDETHKVSGVVLVATDETKEWEATQAAERERAYARTVVNIVRNKNQFLDFIREAKEILATLRVILVEAPRKPLDVERAFRLMHTLKGGAALFSVGPVARLAHDWEGRLSQLRSVPAADVPKELPDLSRGVAATNAALAAFLQEHREVIGQSLDSGVRLVELAVPDLMEFSESLEPAARKAFVNSFIKEPVWKFFQHYEPAVREIGTSQGKSVHLKISGGDLRVLGTPYRELFQNFIHAFRNAIDHGIEAAAERRELGKPEEGEIEIEFSLVAPKGSKPWLKIVVQDDGKGIDPEVIRVKLREAGRGDLAARESDADLVQHVFDSGFSTKETVTDVSGRGVGMSSILHAAKDMGGTAKVFSFPHKGTQLVVMVPLIEDLGETKKAA